MRFSHSPLIARVCRAKKQTDVSLKIKKGKITLIAGLCLGAVHEVTLDPIAKAQLAAATKTYKEVFPCEGSRWK